MKAAVRTYFHNYYTLIRLVNDAKNTLLDLVSEYNIIMM